MAGVNIEEDRGLDLAVIFEDPAIDPEPQYDDPLWGLSHGLQGSFIAGRDVDANGRDVKITDLANRFDANLNGCPAPVPGDPNYPYSYRSGNASDWGLPCNAFQVVDYHYEFSDGVHEFMQTQALQIFNDYFSSPAPSTTPSYINLLFAREMRNRSLTYGEEAVTCSFGECTFDFSTQSLVTLAVLNWSPYKWDGSEWSAFPLEDYLDILESNLPRAGRL